MTQELMAEVDIICERINHLGRFADSIREEIFRIIDNPKAQARTGRFLDGIKGIPIAENLLTICDLMDKLVGDLEIAVKKVGVPSDEFYKEANDNRGRIDSFRKLGKKIVGARRSFKDDDGLVEFDKKNEVH